MSKHRHLHRASLICLALRQAAASPRPTALAGTQAPVADQRAHRLASAPSAIPQWLHFRPARRLHQPMSRPPAALGTRILTIGDARPARQAHQMPLSRTRRLARARRVFEFPLSWRDGGGFAIRSVARKFIGASMASMRRAARGWPSATIAEEGEVSRRHCDAMAAQAVGRPGCFQRVGL